MWVALHMMNIRYFFFAMLNIFLGTFFSHSYASDGTFYAVYWIYFAHHLAFVSCFLHFFLLFFFCLSSLNEYIFLLYTKMTEKVMNDESNFDKQSIYQIYHMEVEEWMLPSVLTSGFSAA